uniref:Uncharacterized LOC100178751 n=1 Tax=Ciona intestinalis TaxID=7719 RepID=F6PKW0_CIOIN|nr:uncharacterized protein LOC100178751 isoform X2 [Ciona intestinalis]|eukprot:XP_002131935.1 uncharacterized protein LOC100178751 isoform X2 [Ciona intestinalis]
MKVICAELLLFVLSAYAAPVEEEAADLQQADIQLTAEKMEPLTREEVKNLCQLEKYKKLRSCTADPQEKQKLAETKEKYRPMFSEVTDYELDISSTSLWGTFRPVTEQHLSNSSDLNSNSRAKRSTCLPINPCIAGYSDKTFIYGSEYSTGKVYEIVLYPEQYLYQRFMVGVCDNNFSVFSFTCCTEKVYYRTVVYLYPTGYETGTKFVGIPGSCALA